MKVINGVNYYTKEDIRAQMGCSIATINNRIAKTGVKGYFFSGHTKYYTEEQFAEIALYRNK